MTDLFSYRDEGHSQSGEEGVVRRVMEVLGKGTGLCCEFGAWDGIHLSNTRRLMLNGWRGLLIEADPDRFLDLKKVYPPESSAVCVCALVDADNNSLDKIANRSGLDGRFDFISIDVDGLDFEIFETLNRFEQPPVLVCVEAGNMHHPDKAERIPRSIAETGIGQPLALFIERGKQMGYRLIGYVGVNAFFLHSDAGHERELPTITAHDAHWLNFPLIKEAPFFREWAYRCNLGLEQPFYKFNSPLYSRKALNIGFLKAMYLRHRDRISKLWRTPFNLAAGVRRRFHTLTFGS